MQSLPPLTDELKSQTIRHRALCLSYSSPLFNHALHGVGLCTVIFKQLANVSDNWTRCEREEMVWLLPHIAKPHLLLGEWAVSHYKYI